jgi:hypothetical protein
MDTFWAGVCISNQSWVLNFFEKLIQKHPFMGVSVEKTLDRRPPLAGWQKDLSSLGQLMYIACNLKHWFLK